MIPTSLKRSHERDCRVPARGRQYAAGIFWLSLMFLCIKVSLNNDSIVP